LDGGDGAVGIAFYMIAVLVSLERIVEGGYETLDDSFGPLSLCRLLGSKDRSPYNCDRKNNGRFRTPMHVLSMYF
jgi:hypothetical protein